ncbi:MAG: PH domain-containing protein [bacterium]
MSHIFPGQDDDEIVQRVVYKHGFSVLPFVGVSVMLFFLGLYLVYAGAAGVSFFPETTFAGFKTNPLPFPISVLGILFVFLSIFMWMASIFIWRQNMMVLTNENVVDIDQSGLFQKRISTLRLSRVQDISVKVKGPIQTIFRYGTVTIQSAGENKLFEFDYVPDPYEVKSYMVKLFEEFVDHKPQEGDGVSTSNKTINQA